MPSCQRFGSAHPGAPGMSLAPSRFAGDRTSARAVRRRRGARVTQWATLGGVSAGACPPATPHADWLFPTAVGMRFGGAGSGNVHLTYGASIGWIGAGISGWEADLSYT